MRMKENPRTLLRECRWMSLSDARIFLARILLAALCVCVLFLSACASDEGYRTEQQAGGTLPWNRPQSWEGAGALGSQMGQMSH